MYDDIVCKYPLPLPEDTKGYIPNGFQTKDLDNALDCYEHPASDDDIKISLDEAMKHLWDAYQIAGSKI